MKYVFWRICAAAMFKGGKYISPLIHPVLDDETFKIVFSKIDRRRQNNFFLLYNFLHLSIRLPNSCKILKDNWCFLSHFWGAKNTNMQKLNIVKYFVENKFLKFLNRFQFLEINYISLWKVIFLLCVQLISKYI